MSDLTAAAQSDAVAVNSVSNDAVIVTTPTTTPTAMKPAFAGEYSNGNQLPADNDDENEAVRRNSRVGVASGKAAGSSSRTTGVTGKNADDDRDNPGPDVNGQSRNNNGPETLRKVDGDTTAGATTQRAEPIRKRDLLSEYREKVS